MAQPVWLTDSGSLGTIEEGKFFQLPLLAEDPDESTVYFTLLSGELPNGIQVASNGLISGIPKAIANVQGVPTEVGENVTSRFSVRAYTKTGSGTIDRLNDRTFNLTVTGQDVPEFTTEPGLLGRWFDGDRVEYQIGFNDPDPKDNVVAYISSGELPAGLTMSTSGFISGHIDPIAPLEDTAIAGWDGYNSTEGTYARWDEFTWDASTRSVNKNYQFTVKITDGKEYRIRTFSMFVYSRDSMTADNGCLSTDASCIPSTITADTDYIRADSGNYRTPYIENYPIGGVLDAYRHDNFFIHQFDGVDPDGDQVQYLIVQESENGFDVIGYDQQQFDYGFDYDTYSIGVPPQTQLDIDTGYLFGYLNDIGLQDITYSFVVRIFKKNDPSVFRDYPYTINIFGDIDIDVTWQTDSDLGTINNGENSLFTVKATHSQGATLQYRLKSGTNSRLPRGLSLQPSGNIVGRVSYAVFGFHDIVDGERVETTFDKSLRTRLNIDETTWDRTYTFTVQAYNSSAVINVERTFTIVVNKEYDTPCQCLRVEAFAPEDDRSLIASLVNNSDIFKPEWVYRPDDPWFGVRKKVWYEHAYGLEPSTFQEYTNAIVRNHYRKKIILGEIKTARALDDAGNILYEVVYSTVVDTAVNNQGKSAALEQTLKYPINSGDSTEIDTVYPNSIDNMRTRVISNIGQVAPILPRWMLSKQENGEILGFTKAWVICYTIPGKSKQVKYNIEEQFGTQLNKVDFDADRYVLGLYSSQHWDSENNEWEESLMTTFDREESAPYATPDDETTFDGGSLRFIYNIDKYEYTDVYDKYVIFPQQRIIDNGE